MLCHSCLCNHSLLKSDFSPPQNFRCAQCLLLHCSEHHKLGNCAGSWLKSSAVDPNCYNLVKNKQNEVHSPSKIHNSCKCKLTHASIISLRLLWSVSALKFKFTAWLLKRIHVQPSKFLMDREIPMAKSSMFRKPCQFSKCHCLKFLASTGLKI